MSAAGRVPPKPVLLLRSATIADIVVSTRLSLFVTYKQTLIQNSEPSLESASVQMSVCAIMCNPCLQTKLLPIPRPVMLDMHPYFSNIAAEQLGQRSLFVLGKIADIGIQCFENKATESRRPNIVKLVQ